ncbi:MAG: clan AA aspartic protease [Magnetococcales bacterium]|nr:clan AA aspartic protease [Magnetococcales bacterium]
MGVTHVTAELRNLVANHPPFTAEFLVDTGAIHCLAPASSLLRAGIVEEGRAAYELADGSVVEYPYGFARVLFMGLETVTQVTFGPEGCEPILGVVALENTGVGVDPGTQSLQRMKSIPLK